MTKKEKILRTSVQLFNQSRDFSKVSIEEIAREARVSPTTIYNNFGTRDRLIAETIKRISADSIDEYREIIDSDMPYPEKIRQCMERKINTVSNFDWDLINRLSSEDPELADFIEKNQNETILLKLIESGKAEGYIAPEYSDDAVIMYLKVLQSTGSAYFKIINAPGTSPETVEQLTRIMFFGLMAKGSEQ